MKRFFTGVIGCVLVIPSNAMDLSTGAPSDNEITFDDALAVIRTDHSLFTRLCGHSARLAQLVDEEGKTLLHYSVEDNNYLGVFLLLENGCDPNAQDDLGKTGLHYAAIAKRSALCRLLLKHGAAVDKKDHFWITPLYCAAGADDPRLVSVLLDYSSALDSQTREGNTALHHAVACQKLPVVRVLLERGAQVTIANNSGVTPLQMAERLDPEIAGLFYSIPKLIDEYCALKGVNVGYPPSDGMETDDSVDLDDTMEIPGMVDDGLSDEEPADVDDETLALYFEGLAITQMQPSGYGLYSNLPELPEANLPD